MKLLAQIGSDLNVNVFACNFRINQNTVNDDVYAANFLNKRIVNRFSALPSVSDPVGDVPFWLTSTELC
jgi:hypothetical protein